MSEIDVIDIKQLNAGKWFYESYVAPRKPCVITHLLQDKETAFGRWTDDYLLAKAGSGEIVVENKTNDSKVSGSTTTSSYRKQFMTYGEFLQAKNDQLYMTTQEIDYSIEACGNPVNLLLGDFPLRPSLLNTLVPWQYNIWQGYHNGSSGLHHDFHDNLYVLLRGEKQFELFGPEHVNRYFEMSGTVSRVYPNGLIAYKGCETREDGAHPDVVAEWQMAKLQRELVAKEEQLEAVDHLPEEHPERIQAARALQEAEQAFDSMEMGPFAEDEEAGIFAAQNEEEDEGDDDEEEEEEEEKEEESTTNALPNNFVINRKEGGLDPSRRFVVELKAGQMLYLPCGWFHEVTSKTVDPEQGNMAFNYWFYPPHSKGSYQSPYVDDLYRDKWQTLQESLVPPTNSKRQKLN